MKLIDREWNAFLHKYTNVWLANNEGEITHGFDPDGAEGSVIIVISSGSTYIKNCDGGWHKYGTADVI